MIYVDDPITINLRFPNWCHMWSATNNIEELDNFAVSIGLRRAWRQMSRGMSGDFPHYDLSPNKRELALQEGAQYKPLRDWILERIQARTK